MSTNSAYHFGKNKEYMGKSVIVDDDSKSIKASQFLARNKEATGSPVMVEIHPEQFEAMQRILKLQEFEVDKADGLVKQEVIMEELEIDKKTLANYLSRGVITPDMYTVSPVNGKKLFYWKKIMGIKQAMVKRISGCKNIFSIRRRLKVKRVA